jgi:hypothetical protein
MKKIVDSMFDEHTVEETKPLKKEEKPNVEVKKSGSNNTVIIVLLVLLILGLIGAMIYNAVKNKKDDGK